MLLRVEQSFDQYVVAGEETAREILAENGPLIAALRRSYDFYTHVMWADGPEAHPLAGVLAINAFMTYLAAIRTAMTGHAGAIFPTLRTALEYSCYAFLITENTALAEVWADRHKSDGHRRASRRAFGQAVAETAKRLNQIQEGAGDWVAEAYELGIDFGAHPNPKGVFDHVTFDEDADEPYYQLGVTGLYQSDHHQTRKALVGCLDFGVVMATVLIRCFSEPKPELILRVNELSADKDRVVADLNAATAATNLAT